MKTNNKGFSLVELIVVIAIMAILAAVAIPTFAGFITKANRSSDESFAQDIEYAIEVGNAHFAADSTKAISGITYSATEKTVSYKVGNTQVTMSASGVTAPASGVTGEDAKILAAAKDVQACIDWTYTSKYYKTSISIANDVVTGN